jgi:uncharacterized protein (DUF58 family)
MTRRGLLLLLLAAVPLAFGGPGTWIALAWAVAVVAAILVDQRRAPSSRELVCERTCDRKLSLGEPNPIDLTLENRGRRTAVGLLRDEFPVELVHDVHTHAVRVEPRAEQRLRYRLTPRRRGAYEFGDVHLRLRGPWNLAVRAVRLPAEQEIRVYPNLLQVKRYELAARRDRAHDVGLRDVRLRGGGTEIERLREYTSDDEYRRIDWKATARRHAPVTRELEAERSQDVLFLLDAGRLMGANLGELTRLDHAINATVLAAHVACKRADRVGLVAFSDRILLDLPARPGRPHFHALLEALYDLRPEPTEPDFERAMLHLHARRRRRSLIVLFTEIFHPETAEALLRGLAGPARRHLLLCVTAGDPETLAIRSRPPAGDRDVDRRAVADRVLRQKADALERLSARGILGLDVPADRLSASVVNRYLEIKARSML